MKLVKIIAIIVAIQGLFASNTFAAAAPQHPNQPQVIEPARRLLKKQGMGPLIHTHQKRVRFDQGFPDTTVESMHTRTQRAAERNREKKENQKIKGSAYLVYLDHIKHNGLDAQENEDAAQPNKMDPNGNKTPLKDALLKPGIHNKKTYYFGSPANASWPSFFGVVGSFAAMASTYRYLMMDQTPEAKTESKTVGAIGVGLIFAVPIINTISYLWHSFRRSKNND